MIRRASGPAQRTEGCPGSARAARNPDRRAAGGVAKGDAEEAAVPERARDPARRGTRTARRGPSGREGRARR